MISSRLPYAIFQHSSANTQGQVQQEGNWKTFIPCLFLAHPRCVWLGSQLLSVAGKGSTGKHSSATDAGEVSVSSSGTAARASSHACVCSDLLGTCKHSVQLKDWCLQAFCWSNGLNLINLKHLPNSIHSKWEKGQSRYQQSEKDGYLGIALA